MFPLFRLILRHTVAQYLIMPYGILIDSAAIAGIALHGVDNAVLNLLHDPHMVGLAVLRAGRTFVVPIEENDHAGCRLCRAVQPLLTVFEPLHAACATGKFRHNAAVDIAALIGTPRYKAGTPFHTAFKSIPRSVRLSAHVADLR